MSYFEILCRKYSDSPFEEERMIGVNDGFQEKFQQALNIVRIKKEDN